MAIFTAFSRSRPEQFTIPLVYTLTVSGSTVTVNASTFTGGATAEPTLTAAGGSLTGGYFKDPVTNIVYTCVVDAGVVTFVDSNNAVYPYPATGTTNTFVASVVVTTAVNLAVDNEPTPSIYPVLNNHSSWARRPTRSMYRSLIRTPPRDLIGP